MKVPIPVHCESVKCKILSRFSEILYVDDLESAACPHCGEVGKLVQCEVIHLIVADRTGPIRSMVGRDAGTRFQFLCESSRLGYLLSPRHPRYPRHYTVVPSAATCSDCLLTYGAGLVNGQLVLS